MRYRAIEIRDEIRDGNRATAYGTVELWDASDKDGGANRVKVGTFTGRLMCTNYAGCGSDGDWQPNGPNERLAVV